MVVDKTEYGNIIKFKKPNDESWHSLPSVNCELADNGILFGKYGSFQQDFTGVAVLKVFLMLAPETSLEGVLCEMFHCTADELHERYLVLFPSDKFYKDVL